MARKGLLAVVLAALVAIGGFAESPFSVGVGLVLDLAFDGFEVRESGTLMGDAFNANIGFGLWSFVDARVLQASLGLFAGPAFAEYRYRSSAGPLVTEEFSGAFVALDFSLLGRFPIYFRNVMRGSSWFPLLGVGYTAVVFATYDGERENIPSDFNTLRIISGVGMDIALGQTNTHFLRLQMLAAYRLPNNMMAESVRYLEPYAQNLRSSGGGFSVTFKAGWGFRLP